MALLDTKFAREVENVFAGANSYLPFPSLLPFSVRGAARRLRALHARARLTGEWKIYAGTPTKLYALDRPTGWTDISRTVGGAYNVPPGDLWMFEQSGPTAHRGQCQRRPATVIDIDSGTNFAALGRLAAAGRPTSSRSAIFCSCRGWTRRQD